MMLRRSLIFAALASLLIATCAAAADLPGRPSGKPDKKNAKSGGKDAKAAEAASPDKPYGDWKKLTKDAAVKKGYFTLYWKRENLYMEIQPAQFNQPVLGIFSFARGIGSNEILGGLPLNDRLMVFQR